MKRSDAVRMLCAIINTQTHRTVDNFSGDYMCTLEEAAVVLKKLEELGMSPPPHSKALLANGLEVRLMDWESEDETK